MDKFMIELAVPFPLTAEFFLAVPAQRCAVKRLMTGGIVLSYTLSQDHSKLWMILVVNSEAETLEILKTVPLIRFMKVRSLPLAFHNTGACQMPRQFSTSAAQSFVQHHN